MNINKLKKISSRAIIFIILGLIFASFAQYKSPEVGYKPVQGFVPNEITAIKVAEAIWLPIYGSEIYNYKPFKAKLINKKIWRVEGTVHTEFGGSPIAEIQKSDCRILLIYHGK